MEMEREVKRLRSDLHEAIETRDFYNVSMSFNGIGTAALVIFTLLSVYISTGAVGRE